MSILIWCVGGFWFFFIVWRGAFYRFEVAKVQSGVNASNTFYHLFGSLKRHKIMRTRPYNRQDPDQFNQTQTDSMKLIDGAPNKIY